jgi:hypothetical protein
LSDALGRRIVYVPMSPDDYRRHLVSEGFAEATAAGLATVYTSVGSGQFAPASTVVRDVTGKRPVAIEQFAREHAEAFGE